MTELERLEFEQSELNQKLAKVTARIKVLRDERNRAEIKAAGLDPDKRYIVDREFDQYYRDNVYKSGADVDFFTYPVIVKWVDGDRAYIITDSHVGNVSVRVPIRFLKAE